LNKYLIIGATVGVVLASGAIWFHGYQNGHRVASDFYVRERELQEAANREAMRLADRRYSQLVKEIENAKRVREEALADADAQADADPDALLCGISAPASVRINNVR